MDFKRREILADDSQAQAYVRSLPVKKVVPFRKVIPKGDPQGESMLYVQFFLISIIHKRLTFWKRCSFSTRLCGSMFLPRYSTLGWQHIMTRKTSLIVSKY